MSLWHILVAICFLTPVVAALGMATDAKKGFLGYAIAVALGLVMGVISTRLMWASGKIVGEWITRRSESLQEWYFRALYFAAVIWIFAVAFLAQWVISAVIRIIV